MCRRAPRNIHRQDWATLARLPPCASRVPPQAVSRAQTGPTRTTAGRLTPSADQGHLRCDAPARDALVFGENAEGRHSGRPVACPRKRVRSSVNERFGGVPPVGRPACDRIDRVCPCPAIAQGIQPFPQGSLGRTLRCASAYGPKASSHPTGRERRDRRNQREYSS